MKYYGLLLIFLLATLTYAQTDSLDIITKSFEEYAYQATEQNLTTPNLGEVENQFTEPETSELIHGSTQVDNSNPLLLEQLNRNVSKQSDQIEELQKSTQNLQLDISRRFDQIEELQKTIEYLQTDINELKFQLQDISNNSQGSYSSLIVSLSLVFLAFFAIIFYILHKKRTTQDKRTTHLENIVAHMIQNGYSLEHIRYYAHQQGYGPGEIEAVIREVYR